MKRRIFLYNTKRASGFNLYLKKKRGDTKAFNNLIKWPLCFVEVFNSILMKEIFDYFNKKPLRCLI